MGRSVSDATRFTPTTPFADSKTSLRNTTIDFAGPAPPNETPKEKVARLREAARRAKLSKESTFDKVVTRGRAVADFAHRATTWTLIGVTCLASVVTVAAVGNLIYYNRTKKAEWLEKQEAKRSKLLAAAYAAQAEGEATSDQLLLISQEKAKELAEEERKSQKGLFDSTRDSLFGGLAKDEAPSHAQTPVQDALARQETSFAIPTTADDAALSRSKTGGPLDQLAANAASDLSKSSKSWYQWITRQ